MRLFVVVVVVAVPSSALFVRCWVVLAHSGNQLISEACSNNMNSIVKKKINGSASNTSTHAHMRARREREWAQVRMCTSIYPCRNVWLCGLCAHFIHSKCHIYFSVSVFSLLLFFGVHCSVFRACTVRVNEYVHDLYTQHSTDRQCQIHITGWQQHEKDTTSNSTTATIKRNIPIFFFAFVSSARKPHIHCSNEPLSEHTHTLVFREYVWNCNNSVAAAVYTQARCPTIRCTMYVRHVNFR